MLEEHEVALEKALTAMSYNLHHTEEVLARAYLAQKIDTCEIQGLLMQRHMDKFMTAMKALYKHELPQEFLNLHTFETNLPELNEVLTKREMIE